MLTKPFFSLLLFVSSPSESSSNSHSLQEMPCLRGLAFTFLQAVSFSHRLTERLSLEKWPWSVSRQLLNICKNRDSTTFLAICATSWSPSQQKKKCFLLFKNLLCSSLYPLPLVLPLSTLKRAWLCLLCTFPSGTYEKPVFISASQYDAVALLGSLSSWPFQGHRPPANCWAFHKQFLTLSDTAISSSRL